MTNLDSMLKSRDISLLVKVHLVKAMVFLVVMYGCEKESESEDTQSFLTLCDPMDCSLPGSSVHGILQVRILEWIAISFSSGLPDSGIKPWSPALQADALTSELCREATSSKQQWVLNPAVDHS